MHIGVFSYYYLPIVNGVTLTIADWMRHAKSSGIQSTIFVPNLGKDVYRDTKEAIPYPAVPLYRRFGITIPMFPETYVLQEISKRNINLLHAHHPFYIGNLALSVKKKYKLPLVFTYHTRYSDYVASYMPHMSPQTIQAFTIKFLLRFLNQCDAITVSNTALKYELLTNGVSTPMYVVPPGVETKRFATANRALGRKRLQADSKEKILLYVGRLAKEKNIYFLMRACASIVKKLPNVKCVFLGHGLEEAGLRAYAKKRGFAKNVVFATQETVETVPDIYAAADMFMYASQTETYGRVIVEAMAAGLPIVALAGPSIVDLLQDGITGRLVFKKSPRLFAQIVLELMKDTDKRTFLASHAQKEAETKYDSAASWDQLSAVYHTVLAKSHG